MRAVKILIINFDSIVCGIHVIFKLTIPCTFCSSRYPYYIGVGHSTNLRPYIGNIRRRVYRAHVVLLCVEPEFRIVYLSDPLTVHRNIYQIYRGPKFWNVVEDRLVDLDVFFEIQNPGRSAELVLVYLYHFLFK